MNKHTCQITMGEYGNYFECGKPAKWKTTSRLRPGNLYLCGTHASALRRRKGPNPVDLTPLAK